MVLRLSSWIRLKKRCHVIQQRLISVNQLAKSSLTFFLVEWRVAYKHQVVLTLGSAPDNRHSFHLHVSIRSECPYEKWPILLCEFYSLWTIDQIFCMRWPILLCALLSAENCPMCKLIVGNPTSYLISFQWDCVTSMVLVTWWWWCIVDFVLVIGKNISAFSFSLIFSVVWSDSTSNTILWYIAVSCVWGHPPSSPFVDVAPKVS